MLGNLRKRFTLIAILVIGALTVGQMGPAFASAPSDSSHTVVPASKIDNDEAGRALFSAIFFMQGKEVNTILKSGAFGDPKLLSTAISKNQSTEAIAITDKIVTEINSSAPQFFATFNKKMRSGNPLKTKAALSESQVLIAASPTMKALIKSETETYVPGQAGPTCFFNVLVGAVAVIAVAAVAVVTLAMGANVAFAYNAAAAVNVTKVRSKMSTENGLSPSDKFIAELSVALKN